MSLTIQEITAGAPLEVINSDGEVVALFARGKPETPKKRTPKPKSSYEAFSMTNNSALDYISEDLETFRVGVVLRVYLKLMGLLDYENEILINQKDIAKRLHISPAQVSRTIKKLVEANYLLIGQRHQGTCKSYRLNPCVAWRGSHGAHRKALDELPEDKKLPFAKVISLADRKAERGA